MKNRSFAVLYLASLLVANISLLLPSANPLRVLGALLLVTFLPGWSWSHRFFTRHSFLWRIVMAAVLSYTFSGMTMLLLHYLPGSIERWQLLLTLNLVALLPLVGKQVWSNIPHSDTDYRPTISVSTLLLYFLIIAMPLALRLTNLNYSEFQGDEALAMISAAESLTGHEDALFLRSKGPSELLYPMAMWTLTGTVTEAIARLPFTLASMWGILTIILLGQRILIPPLTESRFAVTVGILAGGFFAFNGFMVAFGRIVQYQALVVWFSSVALLLLLVWQQTGQKRLAFVSGLSLGMGLLAHYDAILVLPALAWIVTVVTVKPLLKQGGVAMLRQAPYLSSGLFMLGMLMTSLPFYLPYSLDPQANRTGEYVGNRIGDSLRNNLPDFFHFNSFYSSFYYIVLTTLLIFAWALWKVCFSKDKQTDQHRVEKSAWVINSLHFDPVLFAKLVQWGRYTLGLLLTLGILFILMRPDGLDFNLFGGHGFDDWSLAFLPFALLLLGLFLQLPFGSVTQSIVVWLAVPFLGYNFVVALGLTHIYTIVPAWSLLSGLALYEFSLLLQQHAGRLSPSIQRGLATLLPPNGYLLPAILYLLLTIFLWNSFVRHDVEYWQDYPAGEMALFWTPYKEPPKAGFFGFAHRAGWKAVGQQISMGELQGDYGSNEEPDVTTWYTRGAPRACDPQPEFYFLADDLIDPVELPTDIIETSYQTVRQFDLSNGKNMRVKQLIPIRLEPRQTDETDETALAVLFDQSATPEQFARSVRGAIPVTVNFANLIQLVGYDIDTQRATPNGRLPVTLYWQALTSIPANYQVFTHLEKEDTGLVAQADGVPVCWQYPTDLWRPGQIIADQHAIPLSVDIPLGDYPLQIGLYLPDTFERLDWLDEAGNPAGNSFHLTTVTISE
ncbi:hypothetical protein QUF64_08505 [Anaerolineales bacterium HSG6]|nr:hypothetical protein [Anaerolineales bacterium HSG6]